jgi:RNA polymerase sigma-70 factor (ECF subfamily)
LTSSLERASALFMPRREQQDARATDAALPATLAQIYDAHFDFVWRNARRLGVPEASADDVTQEVFIVVQRRIADFDGRAPMRAWLFGILVRVVRDHHRSYRRKGARTVSFDQELGPCVGAAPGPAPSELAERAERMRLLDTVLSQLDEDKRTLIILSELEDWTLREIAERFGSNINTIYSRLRAAKRAFEKAYIRSHTGREDVP